MPTPDERTVAGLRCGEVLEMLSDFIDGELDAPKRSRVEEHLRGCDWCERFGQRFTGIVTSLRRELRDSKMDGEVTARLRQLLERETKR